ncbi:MAG: G8 domain-containing protein, partial [Chitinophagaceae bacterium]
MKTPSKEIALPSAQITKKVLLLTSFLVLLAVRSLFAQETIAKPIIKPVARAVVNFKELAAREIMLPRPTGAIKGKVPNEVEYEEPHSTYVSPEPDKPTNVNRISVVSPSPVLDYEGAPDEAQGGGTSGTWNIPPDTYGAVGLDKVFTTLNNNYRILNKATGASLSLVSMPSFWSSLGTDGAGAFDPRVIYDPYNNRWILAAVSNGGASSSRVLLGISTTHDPQGTYNLFAFDPDAGSTLWADFPMLGFNKNWVAISVNLFTIAGGTFSSGTVYAIDYPTLLTGSATGTAFTGIAAASGGFCMHPATTYSSSESTLYLVSHLSSGGATYKQSTITGTPSVPTLTIGATKTRTGGGWATSGGNIMPQQCLSSCPGTLVFVDPGDQFHRNNVVFRNGAVWYSQTVRLPAVSPTHTLAQWTKLTASTGDYADGGRIEVPTATSSNGEHWYGHPSVAVNSTDDVLFGFAKGESDGYIGAAYAMRLSTDAAGTTEDVYIYKDGLDYYEKDFGSGRNRWGDYSHSVIDPVDDASFWTLQEYAKLRAAPTVGGSTSKWGTWWAKVVPNACLSAVASGSWSVAGTWGCGGVPTSTKHVSIISGHNVTLDVNPSAASITVNSGGTLTISSARILSCKLIVYGTLNITGGKLTLGSNDVFLAEGATLTGASSTSYFVTNSTGKLTKIIPGGSSFEFPVSPNTTSY